jgi:hypothetical protein
MIDAAAMTRFTAHSFNMDSTFGTYPNFIILAFLWLRDHNVRDHICSHVDNGAEFCIGGCKRENQWDTLLGLLDASIATSSYTRHNDGIIPEEDDV